MESFIALIDRLNASAAHERDDLEREIATTFEIECAVLALDMTGYSSSVRRDGIVQHLCRIRRMQLLIRPLIEQCGGQIVRELADNILAVFPDAASGVEAALAVRATVAKSRDNHPMDRTAKLFGVSIGIDHGKLLLVAGHDCFGDPVNIAFKLGEDIADAGEILITDNVRKQLASFAQENAAPPAIDVSISGVDLLVYKL